MSSLVHQQERCMHANEVIRLIATHGRKFFSHDDRVAELQLDGRGRVWFLDAYSGVRIYTHYSRRWKGFSHGGTMRGVIECLRNYIKQGEPLPLDIICPARQSMDRNIWGYPVEDAHQLRAACCVIPVFTGFKES